MINLEIINYGNPIEETISVNSIVSTPIERLSYSKYLTDRSVPISYIESSNLNIDDNLEIDRLDWKIPENNLNLINDQNYFVGSKFFSGYKNILFTNRVYFNKNQEEEPLFFKHKRKVKEASVYYVSKGDKIDVEYGYKIEDSYFYTNYKNVFDYKTGKYKIFFISGVDLEGNSFNELLNLEPAIRKASWEDIDLETGEFLNEVYTVEEESSGFSFLFNRNTSCDSLTDKYYYKILPSNILQLKKEEAVTLNERWLVKIAAGNFIQSGKKYNVPEYDYQSFSGEYGLLRNTNRNCYQVTSNIIHIPSENLKVAINENIHIDVLIYDSEENLIKCLTTNNSLIGLEEELNILWEEGIVSVDEFNSFVEIDITLTPSNIVKANYYYKSESLIYKDVSFNPFENEKILYKNYFFYLKPNQNLRSIHHLVLDEDSIIEEASDKELKIEVDGNYNPNHMIGKSLQEFKELYCYGQENTYDYMELGHVTLKEDVYLDDLLHFDVRRKESLDVSNIESIVDRSWKLLQSKFGYGSKGQTFQDNNILYIEVPNSILSIQKQTPQEVERNIRRYLPADTDIIIEYTYPKSSISFDLSVAQEVTLSLSWEELGNYKIYRSQSKIFSEDSLIATISSSSRELLSFTDTDVVSGERYYYWVRINENPVGNIHGVKVR